MATRGKIGGVASRFGRGARSLLGSAGRAQARAAFEALEPRVLLSGDLIIDAPGLNDVFPSGGGTGVVPCDLDAFDPVTGSGFASGDLDSADVDDFFRFTADRSGFVSVLAFENTQALNTAVEVFLPDGTELTGPSDGLNNAGSARGTPSDGWFGFVAQAGQEYYIRVIAENAASINPTTPAGYVLQLNVNNTSVALTNGVGRTGSGAGQAQTLTAFQQDRLYTFTTGAQASLGYVLTGDVVFGDDGNGYVTTPNANRDLVDTRVEVYNEDGALITADSDSGHIWDAFATVRFEANQTYFVRVRSDAPTTSNQVDPQVGGVDDVSQGQFELRVQTLATNVALNTDTRVGLADRSSSGVLVADGTSATPINAAGLLRDQHSAQVFSFDALGDGQAIASFFTFGSPAGLPPYAQIVDTRIALFDESSSTSPLQTNDTLIPFDAWDRPGVRFIAEGGERYYLIVDAFDGVFLDTGDPAVDVGAGQFDYRLAIEAAQVLDESDPDQPLDDHIDFLETDTDMDGTNDTLNDVQLRDFATPLVWGNPFLPVGFTGAGDYGMDFNGNGVPDAYVSPAVTQFPNVATDHSVVVHAFAEGRLHDPNDTDVFTFTPQVDMVGTFEGAIDPATGADGMGNPPQQTWLLNGRPASRLTVNVFFEAEWFAFGGSAVQVYDSNFMLVEEAQATPIFSVNQGFQASGFLPNPAGIESPSLLGPQPTTTVNIDTAKTVASVTLDARYFAGEAYYIVISAPLGASRYNMVVQADAFDPNGSIGGYSADAETVGEGAFGQAQELVFDTITGVATNNNNLNNTADLRAFGAVASGRVDDMGMPEPDFFDMIAFEGQLGLIHNLNDTDLYRFTAPNNGTAEILLSTTGLRDTAIERFIDSARGVIEQRTFNKTYDSPLDAAIRVFDSQGTQVAYIDDFLGYNANGQIIALGNSGQINVENLEVRRKDPRLVINVEAGEQYFVLVESSQRWSANADDPVLGNRVAANPANGDVDWRRATGSYQLVINATPNQGDGDDHTDFGFGNFAATVISIDSDPSSPTNGTGSVTGVLENDADFDLFEFVSPTSGAATLVLDPQAGLSASIFVLDGQGTIIPLINNSALDGEELLITLPVSQGERLTIGISSLSSTGSYEIRLSNLPVFDDLIGEGRFANAEALTFGSLDRTVTTTGDLEQAGDADLYTFVGQETDTVTLTLRPSGTSLAFAGSLVIYELSNDATMSLNPIHSVVGYELNTGTAPTIQLQASTQAGRRYFVLVRGADADTSQGDYELEVSYNPDDDHADQGQLADASFVNIVPESGAGSITGVLEQASDSDLFVFGVPASGPVNISLVWTPQTNASFTIQLLDVNGNPVDADMNGSLDTVSGTSGILSLSAFNGSPGDIFYVVVSGATATDIPYTLNINTGALDDHANEGDTTNATPIIINPNTGDGSQSGVLEVDDDSDLFVFTVGDNGAVDVTVQSVAVTTPVVRIFDANGALVSTTAIAGGVRFTNAAGIGATYFVSVSSTFPGFRSGAYSVFVDGPPEAVDPNDDHANEGALANATVLAVSQITGNASRGGVINTPADTDLFRYVAAGAGELFIQVVTALGSTSDFTVRIFDASGVELTQFADSTGISGAQGVTAATSLTTSAAGQVLFILVDSTNDADTGSYTLNVDGATSSNIVFYPEGFANASIREFVSLANPNNVAVSYTIRVFYADGSIAPAVVASGTLAAGARGGATLSFGGDVTGDGVADFAPGIVANRAYAIVVESTLRLAAGLSHYDSGILGSGQDPEGVDRTGGAIGEVFTDRLANRWSFPDVERNPGVSQEFLVYFNPNAFDVDITVTAFTSSGQVTLSTITLGANRRGGIEIHNTAAFPLGTFALEVTSRATNPANEPLNDGIVAAVSRYNLLEETAYGYLGVPDGGSRVNIVGSLANGSGVTSELNLFNTSSATTTVTIVGSYLSDQGLPDLIRVITLAAGQRFTLTGQALAFVPNTPIALRVESTQSIAVSSIETQRGDATATAGFAEAGNSFFFGDAFLNPLRAGTLYSEALTLYNPSGADADATITFYFADGSAERTLVQTVAAQSFARLQLENISEVVSGRPELNFFSIRVDSASAIIAQLSHFDGFLGGGWAAGGAPLGLTNPIA